VVDSCKVTDGDLSVILILSETMDGRRELSLQAPWSQLTTITPPVLRLDGLRDLGSYGRKVDRDIREPKTESAEFANSNLAAFRNSRLRGVVDITDKAGRCHQLRIQLQPSCPQVRKILDACRSILPCSHAEKFVAGWWHVMQWLSEEDFQVADREWSCIVIQLLAVFLSLGRPTQPPSTESTLPQRKRRGPSGSFGSVKELEDWRTLQLYETPNSGGCPSWIMNRGWQWAMDEDIEHEDGQAEAGIAEGKFMSTHIKYAKLYMASGLGQAALGTPGYLPTAINRSMENRNSAALAIFMSLHLLLEEQKLNVATPEYLSPGPVDIRVVLCQIARWLQWPSFAMTYELGIQEELDPRNDAGKHCVCSPFTRCRLTNDILRAGTRLSPPPAGSQTLRI
jgi:anaphase-promoting complex subunit 1